MTYKQNITAILECYFAGFKEEIIDSACNRILEQELEQEPCEDAISRQAALGCCRNEWEEEVEIRLKSLPPVNPHLNTGHWLVDGSVDCYLDKVRCHCSECGKKKEFPADYDHIKHKLSISYQYPEFIDNYCPNCGCRMIEPQESENKK